MRDILLCADSESLKYPAILGLDDVALESIPWMIATSDARKARKLACDEAIDEAWVASSDEMDSVNLAAAIRICNKTINVYVIAFETCGSLLSRAQAAGITGVLGLPEFANKFSEEKTRRCRTSATLEAVEGELDIEEPPPRLIKREKPESPAFLMTVLSGSGGAGKSTISALAACLAAERGHKTLLLDCDLQFGDLHRLMGVKQLISADDAMADPELLQHIAEEAPQGQPVLLAAPQKLERADIVAKHLPDLLDDASRLFDVVIANTGASWAEYHATLIEHSTFPLFLIDQRASSVRACQHALDLCTRMGLGVGQFAYAINHCERGALFTSVDVACAMHGAHVYELKEGGNAVEEMLGSGQADELSASRNDLCASVGEMLAEVLPSKSRKKSRRRRAAK